MAVINNTLRKRYFGDEDPIGKQIVLVGLASGSGGASATFRIAGVVQDIRNRGLEEPIAPQVFIPYTATPLGSLRILIRTSLDPHRVAGSLRSEMRAVNANVLQRDALIIDEQMAERSYARPRFSVLIMAVFGVLGLVLVGSGVYGVMTFVVSRQVREIGIRMALGARRGQVFGWVFGGAFRLIGVGLVVGGLASIAANRIIASQVWTVRAFDPIALGAAVVRSRFRVLGRAFIRHSARREWILR